MLAQHLREMERDGLIIRTDLSGRLRHVEYLFQIRAVFAVLQLIKALTEWGSQYAPSLPRPEPARLSGTTEYGLRDCKSSSLRDGNLLLGSR